MNNFRKRVISGKDEYIFTSTVGTIVVGSSSSSSSAYAGLTSTKNGKDCQIQVSSKSSFISSVTIAKSTGTGKYNIRISYSSNNSLSQRYGTIKLIQDGSGNEVTVNVTQYGVSLAFEYAAVVLDGSANNTTSLGKPTTESITITSNPDWVNITQTSSYINITSLSATSTSGRWGTISFTGGGKSTSVEVYQMPSSYSTIDGYPYVIINGLKIATKNVGASSEKDVGNYYQWGVGATSYTYQSQYNTTISTDGEVLPSNLDTATQVMGGAWRMPTKRELGDAIYVCTRKGALYNNTIGVICRYNDTVFLFLPRSGYYESGSFTNSSYSNFWTSTSSTKRSGTYYSYYTYYNPDEMKIYDTRWRFSGFPIRAVHS